MRTIRKRTTFIVALYKQNDVQGVGDAITILIPKLGQIVRGDEEVAVVLAALESFSYLLKDLKHIALLDDKLIDTIFTCINDVLLGKVSCQFDKPAGGNYEAEESEYDEAIVEVAGTCHYIAIIWSCPVTRKVRHVLWTCLSNYYLKIAKGQEFESQRGFVYGAYPNKFSLVANSNPEMSFKQQ